jgi:hypothetical protein
MIVEGNVGIGTVTPTGGLVVMNGNVGIGTWVPNSPLTVVGPMSLNPTVTEAGTTYTMAVSDSSIIINGSGSYTITLLNPASYPGRILYIKTIVAHTVSSASSNVCPTNSATAGTAILSNAAGDWAILQSDGTNWIEMASGTSSGS